MEGQNVTETCGGAAEITAASRRSDVTLAQEFGTKWQKMDKCLWLSGQRQNLVKTSKPAGLALNLPFLWRISVAMLGKTIAYSARPNQIIAKITIACCSIA